MKKKTNKKRVDYKEGLYKKIKLEYNKGFQKKKKKTKSRKKKKKLLLVKKKQNQIEKKEKMKK